MTKNYLRQHWLWLALPFVLVAGGLGMFCLLMDGGGLSPFVCTIH